MTYLGVIKFITYFQILFYIVLLAFITAYVYNSTKPIYLGFITFLKRQKRKKKEKKGSAKEVDPLKVDAYLSE